MKPFLPVLLPIAVSALSLIAAAASFGPVAIHPAPAAQVSEPEHSRELVVLVHGMGRTSRSMLPLAQMLEREGFEVVNWSYSSFGCSIAELSEQLQAELQSYNSAPIRRIHFVGHSLGSIIIRAALAREDAPANVGRIVMLAPPNQGSRQADRFAPYFGRMLKPLPDLRTDPTSTVRTLPSLRGKSVGVIAGKYDGKVSLAETHLSEEAAHVVVPATHSFLMGREDVQRLVLGFLRQGKFPGKEVEQ